MSEKISPMLRNKAVIAVSAVLLLQIVLFSTVSTSEHIPNPPPLSGFLTAVGAWHAVRESPIETEVQALLKADDTLNREYAGPDGTTLNLFVAFFKSQRAGVSPHSPKVCLPAAGWVSEDARRTQVTVPGESSPIPVNLYTVTHGLDQSTVLYWYQGAHRAVADEYKAKLFLIVDSLRYRRSDQALVRVIVPIVNNQRENAERTAIGFVQTLYEPLKRQIWPDTMPAGLSAQAGF